MLFFLYFFSKKYKFSKVGVGPTCILNNGLTKNGGMTKTKTKWGSTFFTIACQKNAMALDLLTQIQNLKHPLLGDKNPFYDPNSIEAPLETPANADRPMPPSLPLKCFPPLACIFLTSLDSARQCLHSTIP